MSQRATQGGRAFKSDGTAYEWDDVLRVNKTNTDPFTANLKFVVWERTA